MTSEPHAIGWLRSDISGERQQWDEARIRIMAHRLGYDLRKTVVFGPWTDRPVHRLRVLISRLALDAVIVPSVEHFDGGHVPAELVAVADVITVSPENTYARYAAGNLPERFEA
ncbi:hypothetical protein D7D52_02055 [Nocardia yunnanensis]|uniref:Uncharacterized protein n=1 Tax=Nocardia yunnanensis TaxID=2382165 RepID=A0A386Z5B8_9NOCA|nr:hypothetical protein [Nocardia yunnanensis]AYF72851.1 hypothetical protein D7D52_02055 [Nocardia yunnanensis]